MHRFRGDRDANRALLGGGMGGCAALLALALLGLLLFLDLELLGLFFLFNDGVEDLPTSLDFGDQTALIELGELCRGRTALDAENTGEIIGGYALEVPDGFEVLHIGLRNETEDDILCIFEFVL